MNEGVIVALAYLGVFLLLLGLGVGFDRRR